MGRIEIASAFAAMGHADITLSEGGAKVLLGGREASADEMAEALFHAARSAKRRAVNDMRDQAISSGFHYAFGDGIGVRTFDQRGESDETAWIVVERIADKLVQAGLPDEPVPLRDAQNQTFAPPAHMVLQAMSDMALWRSAIAQRSWDLKDQVDAAQDHAALEAIDIIADWP